MHQVIAVMITGLRMSHQILAPSKVPDGLLDHCPSSMRMQAPEVGLHTVPLHEESLSGRLFVMHLSVCHKRCPKITVCRKPKYASLAVSTQPLTNSFVGDF